MSFWDSNDQTADNLAKLGPLCDGFVGTGGKYTDLYEAINTGGWSKMFLTAGAYLSQDLTISSPGFVIGLEVAGAPVNLGAKKIVLDTTYFRLERIQINGAGTLVGPALEIKGGGSEIYGCRFTNILSGGAILFNTTDNDYSITKCTLLSNGGNGITTSAGASGIRIVNNLIYDHSGYGVDDTGGDYTIIMGNRMGANVSGDVNPGTYTLYQCGTDPLNQVN